MNIIDLIRLKNRLLGSVMPDKVAQSAATMFLSPRRFGLKDWEQEAEKSCVRLTFGQGLSAASWGNGDKKVLLMHGWESRATQMYSLVVPLVESGFTVVAIDGPKHGHSKGQVANPVAFGKAIEAAVEELGPFHGAVGHSMGGAAVALAIEGGARFDRCVLLSSPSCLYDVLVAFGDFIGLSAKVRSRFIEYVEQRAGRPSKELDVARIFSELKPEALMIHARDDKEVPYSSMMTVEQAYPEVQTYSADDLGHRKILRDASIAGKVAQFIKSGAF